DTDTAEAASATAMISIITRSRSKGNPIPMAVDSFNCRMLSLFARYKESGTKTINQGRRAQIKGQSVPQMFHASHLAIKSTYSLSEEEISTIIRPDRAREKPTPVITNLVGCNPLIRT